MFPGNPTGHKHRQVAVPQLSGFSSMLGCFRSLGKYIPADADIVIVEFALNDKNSTKPWCGMETPVR